MGLDRYAPIAVGGAIGALIRWAIAETLATSGFPWHTLLVNVVGCGLLALVTAETVPERAQRFLAVGFCGGLTTFSTLSLEVAQLLDGGDIAIAASYVAASIVLGLAAYLGARSLRPHAPIEVTA